MDKQYVVMNCDGEDCGYEQDSVHLTLEEALYYRKRLLERSNKKLYIFKILSQQEIDEAESHLTN